MKKILLFMTVATMSLTVNAKILRVNNNTGSSAPYSSFNDALSAAEEGDTIMVDASPLNYGAITIKKRIVVIGPGYDLVTNGIIEEGVETANFNGITIEAEGTVLSGVESSGTSTSPGGVTIKANKVVITRCWPNKITLRNASNSVIHQNCINSGIEGYGSTYQESYIQITNNIIKGRISDISNGYIAYNTLSSGTACYHCQNCEIEYNWGTSEFKEYTGTGNHFANNYESRDYSSIFNKSIVNDGPIAAIDVDATLRGTYGAFAGDSPYILSGVPAGPVVQDLIVPTTVEQGSKLQVTVKVGIQK